MLKHFRDLRYLSRGYVCICVRLRTCTEMSRIATSYRSRLFLCAIVFNSMALVTRKIGNSAII